MVNKQLYILSMQASSEWETLCDCVGPSPMKLAQKLIMTTGKD